MDPEACLDAAEEAMCSKSFDEAAKHLDNYFAWRNQGGFEPLSGDKRAVRLLKKILEEGE